MKPEAFSALVLIFEFPVKIKYVPQMEKTKIIISTVSQCGEN